MPTRKTLGDRYIGAMLGRALFVVVCLIIVAGVALPLYPSEVVSPAIAGADGGLLLADAPATGCEDCDATASLSAACPIGRSALRRSSPRPAHCLSLTVYLVVRPALPGARTSDPSLLPLRLPTI